MQNLTSIREAILEANAKGVQIIGSIVQWSIPQRSTAKLAEIENDLKAEGVSQSTLDRILPKPITLRKSFTKAIQAFNAKHRTSQTPMKFRKLKSENPGQVVYALTELKANNKDRNFDLDNRGWVCLIDNEVRSNDDSLRQQVESLMTTEIGASEVRSTLSRWCRMRSGFTTRKGGGSYFVPNKDEFSVEADAITKVFQSHDCGMLITLPVLGGEVAKKNIANALNSSILIDIETFRREVKDFFSKNTRKQKGATLKRLDEAQELRKYALSYEGLLGPIADDVRTALDDIEAFVQSEVQNFVSNEDDDQSENKVEVVEADKPKEPTAEDVQEFLKKLDEEEELSEHNALD